MHAQNLCFGFSIPKIGVFCSSYCISGWKFLDKKKIFGQVFFPDRLKFGVHFSLVSLFAQCRCMYLCNVTDRFPSESCKFLTQEIAIAQNFNIASNASKMGGFSSNLVFWDKHLWTRRRFPDKLFFWQPNFWECNFFVASFFPVC